MESKIKKVYMLYHINERKDEKREGSPPDLDSDGKGL